MNSFVRTVLVFLFFIATYTRVHADVNPLSFNSAFGLNGQRWQYNRDTYIANKKTAYILSMDGVYIEKGDGKWTVKLFSRKVLSTYGLPSDIAVTKSGNINIVFNKQVPLPEVYRSTLLMFDRDLKETQTIDLGARKVHNLDVINGETVTFCAWKSINDQSLQITDVKKAKLISTDIPSIEFGNINYRIINNQRYVMYSDDNSSKIVRYAQGRLSPDLVYTIQSDEKYGKFSDFAFHNGSVIWTGRYVVVMQSRNGIHVKYDEPSDDPRINNSSKAKVEVYDDGTILSYGERAYELLSSTGESLRVVGGYGDTFQNGGIDYCGVNVSDSQVWVPVPTGIQVLGDDQRLITVTDTRGDSSFVTAIDIYDEKHVTVAYSSRSNLESGILLLDKVSGKQRRRFLVKQEPSWYSRLVVLSVNGKPRIYALSPEGLVSDYPQFSSIQGFTDLKRMGNNLMLQSESGFTRLAANGKVLSTGEYPQLVGSIYLYAFLSNGWYVSGQQLYDQNGNYLYSFLGSVVGCLSMADNSLMLQVDETISVIYKY
jgi:hypothetical protein